MDNLNDKISNEEQSQPSCLGAVMPSFLIHPYAQVVCKNKGELLYVLEWAKREGKVVSEFMWNVKKFPYHLFLEGKIVGWTDLTDRIGEKVSFAEFCRSVNWA